MADPFLDDCGGWTPAPDVLTRNYGFESAYLWGRLRRLCQLGKGTYTISPEALGKRFGMSRRTVIDRLKAMIQDGYIEDLTPGVRNKAHTYSVQKGEDKILTGVQISHTEDDIPTETPNPDTSESDVGMRNLHSDDAENAHLDDAGMQDLPNRYAEIAHPGMQNLHLNRDSSTTTKEGMNQIGDLCKEHFSDPAVEPYRTQLLETVNRYSAVKVLWAIQTALSPDRQNGRSKSWGYVLGILEKDERRLKNQTLIIPGPGPPQPSSRAKSPPIDQDLLERLQAGKE